MRLIDADAITNSNKLTHKLIVYNFTPYIKVDDLLDFIDDLPTIEAVPVVHGEWVESKCLDECFWVCSKCKFPIQALAVPTLYYFCPICGAKMDGKK